MHPIIHLGPLEIPSYGTVIFTGLVIGTLVAMFTSKKYNIAKLDVCLSTILAGIGLIIGAKLLYMITIIPEVITNYSFVKTHVFETLIYAFSGYVFYGGLIGALLGYFIYCRWFKIDFRLLVNVISPVIPLVHAFGRIGCFLGGCCYGMEYHGRFAIHFPENEYVPELNDVPRFPVQLLESGINFLLFLILMVYGRKRRKPGIVLGIYLICYAIIRFVLEFFRGDTGRGIFFGISTSQWISIPLICIGICLTVIKPKKTVSTDSAS